MDGRRLHVAQISFFLDPERRTPAGILRDWWALTDVAEMVERCGACVTVIQACSEAYRALHHGVTYHFLPPERRRSTMSTAPAFAALIRELRADVFHVHGLGFPKDVLRLARLAPNTPIFQQDHADRVPPLWRRRVSRRGMAAAAGIGFCAVDQARPFARAGLIRGTTRVYEIPEASSRFTPGNAGEARRATGVVGNPALLWVGHLDTNKDPLTILDGVAAAVSALPGLQLWCCFVKAPLMPEIRRRIDTDSRLRGRVHLLGPVTHPRIEQLMRAADLFVLGSHREGSGFSVIEALACGLPPVVTDIPSFRTLTGNGAVGELWPVGDADEFGRALIRLAAKDLAAQRAAARAHFDREVSPQAVGRKLLAAYRTLHAAP